MTANLRHVVLPALNDLVVDGPAATLAVFGRLPEVNPLFGFRPANADQGWDFLVTIKPDVWPTLVGIEPTDANVEEYVAARYREAVAYLAENPED